MSPLVSDTATTPATPVIISAKAVHISTTERMIADLTVANDTGVARSSLLARPSLLARRRKRLSRRANR